MVSYSDGKLYVTPLLPPSPGCGRMFSVMPSIRGAYPPTRMGGPGAPDDLRLGHLTQEWLATSDDPEATTSGGYWFHQHRQKAILLRTPSSYRTGF